MQIGNLFIYSIEIIIKWFSGERRGERREKEEIHKVCKLNSVTS